MKQLLQTLFFFLLVTQICFGQWYQQNSGTDIDLIDVDFFDANNGIADGWHIRNPGYFSESIIFRTTNAGESWNIQGYFYDIISVQCLDSLNGFGTGYATFIKTVDGGITWTQQTMGDYTILNGVNFSDANTGTAVGYEFDSLWNPHAVILRTTDGGNSWLNQTSPEFHYLFAVYFVDNNYGWIVGEVREWNPVGGVILNTTDGGTTWTEQWTSTMISLTDVYFTDVYNGVAVGTGGTILRTTDGGTSWTSEISGTTADLWGVTFIDSNNGWIAGNEGVFNTINGGTNWTQQTSGGFRGASFINSDEGWTAGYGGTILHTTNGGVSFVEEEQFDEIPTEFLLSQNYPNPFNPSTRIKYQVASNSHVSLVVYDILGNEIETLVNEEKPAGTYELTWYAEGLPSGVYFYQLRAGSFVETKKMILLK